MSVMTMVKAINNALDIKLKEDAGVVIYGEDVGVEGGVFRVTEGLQKKYGVKRSLTRLWQSQALWGLRSEWLSLVSGRSWNYNLKDSPILLLTRSLQACRGCKTDLVENTTSPW